MESTFDNLDIDAMTGARLMQSLGLTKFDLDNPQKFERFKQVLDFLKQYPEDTQNFLISKVTTGKVITDKLDKFFEYSQLLQKKQALSSDMENLKKEAQLLSSTSDPFLRMSNAQKEINTMQSLRGVENEIQLYEK